MSVTVPNNVSFSQAFANLYNAALPFGRGFDHPYCRLSIRTHEEAMRVFFTYCPRGYCDYVRGRPMKIDFGSFPQLNVETYELYQGPNLARQVIPSNYPIEGKPVLDPTRSCEFFSFNEKVSLRDLEEFFTLFDRCATHKKI